jgi:hypothetical protein
VCSVLAAVSQQNIVAFIIMQLDPHCLREQH